MGRIVFFAVLAMLLQLLVVFSDYYWNDGELSRLFVEQETDRLADGVSGTAPNLAFTLPESLAARYARQDSGYVARVRTDDGRILFASCSDDCERRFLPLDMRPPNFWLRTIRPGKPLTLVGGRAFVAGNQTILVEVATIGDPQDVLSDVLGNEVLEHMIVPMSILLVLVLGGTLLSVRKALRPVRAAALAADAMDPFDSRSHLLTDGMPLEIAHLAEAVNRAFARVGELMKSQKVLTSGIAHEVRTPLAAMKLELSRIDHPRARKAEADLDELVRFVGQLTALARLDSFDRSLFTDVDLSEIASEVVQSLAPWVYGHQHSLALEGSARRVVKAVDGLLKDAIRNLIENAVRHTPPGTAIVVRTTANGIDVEDLRKVGRDRHDGDGQAQERSGGMGIGLKIVQQIAVLHGAVFTHTQTGHGRIAQLRFQDNPGPALIQPQ
ncbi:ATP-binding protein [Rhizobium sp. BK376]|uniref:ATP-binding protein n=1 Tax=Rhizobium sp. BK376 TaxID=2512149 RepID=UPI001044D9BC|nr:ATP-binding protein [Rhizobium sp. BK376]